MANDKKNKNLEDELKKIKKELKDQEKKYEEAQKELTSKEDELAKITNQLKEEEEKTEEYISHSQRLQADFENFKKQTDKRNKEIIKFANENLIINILDIYEDLERALEKSNTEEELKEGVKLIYSKLKDILTKEGLKEIPAVGEKFDPFKHEALMTAKSDDYENGYIIDELMKGYILKDKVIKYSKVRVCKK